MPRCRTAPRHAGDPGRLGLARGPGRQRRAPGPHARSSTRSGQPARTPSCAPPARTSACPTGRWATPRSATSTSAPAAWSCRTCRASTTAVADGSIGRLPALTRPDRGAEGDGRHLPPASACSRRAACTATRTTPRRWPSARGGRRAGARARLHRRPRHAAALRPPATWRAARGACRRRRPRSPPSRGRYYAMDRDNRWERVAQAYASWSRPRAPALRRRRRGDRRRLCARTSPTSSSLPPSIGDYAGMRDGDGMLCFNFRADRVRRDPGGAARSGLRRVSARRTAVRFAAAVGPDAVQHRARRASSTRCSRRTAADVLGEVVARGRPHPAAHGRDREIPARHLLPERRRGDALPRRGPHHGARRPRSRPTTCSPRCRRPS